MTKFTKQAESLFIGIHSDATNITAKCREICDEIYTLEPDIDKILTSLNYISECIETMKENVLSLTKTINNLTKDKS